MVLKLARTFCCLSHAANDSRFREGCVGGKPSLSVPASWLSVLFKAGI